MTNGGEEKKGTLILPNQAVEDKILQPYLKEFPQKIHRIKPNTKYKIKNIEIETSIEHRHGIENYGFVLKTKKNKIGHITDTGYFPELLKSYLGCDMLIINVPYHKNYKLNPKHLDIPAVEELIKEIKPKKVILTHFNSSMLEENPSAIAKNLSEKFETNVIAAEDDMILEI